MSHDIRIFDVVRSRDGSLVSAVICNSKHHYRCTGNLEINSYHRSNRRICDADECQATGSEVIDVSQLGMYEQDILGIRVKVPNGTVLVGPELNFRHTYAGGEEVTPKQLETGRLLADGEGATYFGGYALYYVRNVNGEAHVKKVGREKSKRTAKKLAKLREGERKSEVTHDAAMLNERLLELMQLHRTPEVLAEIDNVKELLRLAASLSVEASIEAAEGNEQIAQELANARAREISAELELTRERLLQEKRIRDEVREELSE